MRTCRVFVPWVRVCLRDVSTRHAGARERARGLSVFDFVFTARARVHAACGCPLCCGEVRSLLWREKTLQPRAQPIMRATRAPEPSPDQTTHLARTRLVPRAHAASRMKRGKGGGGGGGDGSGGEYVGEVW